MTLCSFLSVRIIENREQRNYERVRKLEDALKYISSISTEAKMIKPICDSCNMELQEFGAILFSPQDSDNNVKKFHICRDCYQKIISQFNDLA